MTFSNTVSADFAALKDTADDILRINRQGHLSDSATQKLLDLITIQSRIDAAVVVTPLYPHGHAWLEALRSIIEAGLSEEGFREGELNIWVFKGSVANTAQ